MIVEITDGKSAICEQIIAELPDWFGIPEANAAYVRNVAEMPVFGAELDGRAVGFLALKPHTPFAAEIYVIGVRPAFHRRGIGRALVNRAEDYLRASGARFLTVKTLSPSRPDPRYAATRKFYEAVGFLPIEEFPTLWSAENPALMMAKVLG
jgi:ribosomal protein S18 acetylase RimI-like enzyme